MKTIVACFFFILVDQSRCLGQNVSLSSIINRAYSADSDKAIFQTNELNYVIPAYLKFVSIELDKNALIKIKYYQNDSALIRYMGSVGEVLLLSVFYEEVAADTMVLTLQITSTNKERYLGKYKTVIAIHKRRIALIYNRETKHWDYSSLLALYHEP